MGEASIAVLEEWTEAERVEALCLYQRWQAAGCRVSFPEAVLQALRFVVAGAELHRIDAQAKAES